MRYVGCLNGRCVERDLRSAINSRWDSYAALERSDLQPRIAINVVSMDYSWRTRC